MARCHDCHIFHERCMFGLPLTRIASERECVADRNDRHRRAMSLVEKVVACRPAFD